jgi:Ca-activated chloride channel family protein
MIFLYPEVLYFNFLLILALLVYVFSKNKIKKLFKKEIFKKLSINQSYLPNSLRIGILFIIFFLITIALARPVKVGADVDIELKGLSIIVALDISKSMLAEDVKPNRLIVAKEKIKKFIDINRNNKIALMAFAGNSFMVAPLSFDSSSLKFLISNLDISSISRAGTSIFALLESVLIIDKAKTKKNIVIFSDGGDESDYSKEIEFALSNDISVNIVSIASEKGAPIKEKGNFILDKNGAVVISKRNDNIAKLSHETDGIFTTYAYSNDDIISIKNHIEKENKKKMFKQDNIISYDEFFLYPLLVALVLVFLAFFTYFKRVLVLILFCYSGDSYAGVMDFLDISSAKKTYANKEYAKSLKHWKDLYDSNPSSNFSYNLANAYYKNNEFKKSIEYFNKTKFTSNKGKAFLHYNKGNAYAKMQDYENAKKEYKKSLNIQDDKDVRYNLKLVEDAEKQKKKQDKKNKDNKDKKDSKDDKKNKKDEDKNKDGKKDNKDSKDKNKDKKDKDKKNSKDDKDKKKSKNKDKKDDKSKDDKEKKEMKKYKAKNISDLQEKRWMKKLQKQKAKSIPLYQFSNKKEHKNDKNW